MNKNINAVRQALINIALFVVITLIINQTVSADCASSHVKLQILGSGGPEMDDQRASSSYLIWQKNKAILLIDTGPGSSYNFARSGAKIEDLEAVLFTHFHVDHSADFPALIKASYFTSRRKNLKVLGPEGNNLMPSASEFISNLFSPKGAYRYLNNYINAKQKSDYLIQAQDISLKKHETRRIPLTDTILLSTIPVHHGPIAAIAWRIDIGDCAITFSGDMSNRYHTLKKLAQGSAILVAHHAIPEHAQGAARNLHMPPSEIGKIAQAAKVKKLVLSHRMKRTLNFEPQTKQRIRHSYTGPILFAEDMDMIE